MKLRRYEKSDAEVLACVYRDAATRIGGTAYDAEQVRVWALYPDDMEEFRERLARGLTLVAQEGDAIAAFGQLDPVDHIAFIYCSSAFSRRGMASAICESLEQEAMAHGVLAITTIASRISRSFLEKQGFVVTTVEQSSRLGVEFERFTMIKKIPSDSGNPAGRNGPL